MHELLPAEGFRVGPRGGPRTLRGNRSSSGMRTRAGAAAAADRAARGNGGDGGEEACRGAISRATEQIYRAMYRRVHHDLHRSGEPDLSACSLLAFESASLARRNHESVILARWRYASFDHMKRLRQSRHGPSRGIREASMILGVIPFKLRSPSSRATIFGSLQRFLSTRRGTGNIVGSFT